jgi:hypothetical protein
MSFSNYDDLVTNVADWLHRDDLTDRIPDFIKLGESRINRGMASRLAETEVALTATIGSRFIELPGGFKQSFGLWLTLYTQRREIIYRVPEQLRITTASGLPYYYTIDGSNIAFDCPASQAYTYALRYKALYDLINTETNYLLDNYPGLYLYATLLEAAIYIRDDERMSTWGDLFKTELEEAKKSEAQNKNNSTLSVDGSLVNQSRFNINTGDYYGS